jgi:DNA-binding transcriptional MerR regulator
MQTTTYLESSDVARELGLSAAMIRVLTAQGHLTPAATTRRGLKLFDLRDVDRLRVLRERRRARVRVSQ